MQNLRDWYPLRVHVEQLSQRGRRARFPERLCGQLSRLFTGRSKTQFTLTCRGGVSLCELAQFIFWHRGLRHATIQTDNKLWEYPYDGLINVFQSEKMDAHLRAEFLLVD